MSTQPIDHARLTEVSERFFAAGRRQPPRDAAEQAEYDRLAGEMIEAMGLTRAEFDRMAAAYAATRRPHRGRAA
ncbi:hypothetical protein [Cellulomonas sp. Marseille-Q8402]